MGRQDGRHMSEIDNTFKFFTFLMPKRVTSSVWLLLRVDVSKTKQFLAEKEAEGKRYTIFQLVIAALVRTASQYPQLNRFIYRHRYYARKEYVVSFAISLGEKTVYRKVWLDPEDTISDVSRKIEDIIRGARENPHDNTDDSINTFMKLPNFISDIIFKLYPWLVDKGIFPKKYADEDILYTSAVVSDLGSFDIGAPHHHLYEWGSASVFLTIGKMQKTPVVLEDDSIAARPTIEFGFTVDERVCDGKTLSGALNLFRQCLENPWSMEAVPERVARE